MSGSETAAELHDTHLIDYPEHKLTANIILGICNFGLEGLRHRHLWPTVV